MLPVTGYQGKTLAEAQHAQMHTDEREAINALGAHAIKVRMSEVGAFNIPAGLNTLTMVTWATVPFSVGSGADWWNAAAPTRLTLPAGLYRVDAMVMWSASTVGDNVGAFFAMNGDSQPSMCPVGDTRAINVTGSGIYDWQAVSGLISFAAPGYLELGLWHDSAAPLAWDYYGDEQGPTSMSVQKVA